MSSIPSTITVTTFLQRLQSVQSLPRPRKTSIQEDSYIVRTALANTKVTNSVLLDITNQELSTSTIRRRFHEEKIHKWRAVTRPLLTKKHANQRLNGQDNGNIWQWRVESGWFGLMRVLCKRIVMEQLCEFFDFKINRKHMIPKMSMERAKEETFSKWCGDSLQTSKLGPIVFVEGTINSDVYIGLLQENLLPFIDALVADRLASPVFQQDNAASHVSNRTKNWFKVATEEYSFLLIKWHLIKFDSTSMGTP